jgi:hypothetical protein
MNTVYIITYEYPQESGHGIVGVYTSEARAKQILAILDAHGDMSKVFKITTVADLEVEK